MSDQINTHGLVIKTGRHAGTLFTRLPVSYLRWMVNCSHAQANIAQAELDRRGTVLPDMDISGHAVDRASVNCRDHWHRLKLPGEGIHSWLCRMGAEALKSEVDDAGRHHHEGMLFAFEMDGKWPVLKTVMRDPRAEKVNA